VSLDDLRWAFLFGLPVFAIPALLLGTAAGLSQAYSKPAILWSVAALTWLGTSAFIWLQYYGGLDSDGRAFLTSGLDPLIGALTAGPPLLVGLLAAGAGRALRWRPWLAGLASAVAVLLATPAAAMAGIAGSCALAGRCP
jgi:hypothetical protein